MTYLKKGNEIFNLRLLSSFHSNILTIKNFTLEGSKTSIDGV